MMDPLVWLQMEDLHRIHIYGLMDLLHHLVNLVSPNTYTVTITDAFGCTHNDTVTVGEPNQITVFH